MVMALRFGCFLSRRAVSKHSLSHSTWHRAQLELEKELPGMKRLYPAGHSDEDWERTQQLARFHVTPSQSFREFMRQIKEVREEEKNGMKSSFAFSSHTRQKYDDDGKVR